MKARRFIAVALGRLGGLFLLAAINIDPEPTPEFVAKRHSDEPFVIPPPEEWPADALRQMAEDILSGRDLLVVLPRSIERRLKAMMHRMNGQLLASGKPDWADFDPEEDLESALISAALEGLRHYEELDGALYDERTGLAVGSLDEEAFDGR